MGATTIHDNATMSDTINAANEETTMTGETGLELRDRRGDSARNIERRWKTLFGRSFSVYDTYDAETVAIYEAAHPVVEKIKKRTSQVRKIAAVAPGQDVVPVTTLKNRWRKLALIAALIIPTGASVTNTFLVSHALSNTNTTALMITGVASATSLLFLWAGVRGIGAWLVVAATLGFEGFCNACSIFKALMGTMAYSLTTVSGTPSQFLDMVANFTGKDHQDAATGIAIFTAAMICGAQVSSIYELKK